MFILLWKSDHEVVHEFKMLTDTYFIPSTRVISTQIYETNILRSGTKV